MVGELQQAEYLRGSYGYLVVVFLNSMCSGEIKGMGLGRLESQGGKDTGMFWRAGRPR